VKETKWQKSPVGAYVLIVLAAMALTLSFPFKRSAVAVRISFRIPPPPFHIACLGIGAHIIENHWGVDTERTRHAETRGRIGGGSAESFFQINIWVSNFVDSVEAAMVLA